MGKYRSDYERLEAVKKFKSSKMTIHAFAEQEGLPRSTLRDWVRAYDNINGSFIKLKKEINRPGVILKSDECVTKILKPEEIYKCSRHFSRFDHSVVVIEFEKIKITTSLEQALKIMKQYYDRC